MADEFLNDDNVELYPPWKEALEAFERAGYAYGDVVTREWFCQVIGLQPLPRDARLTIDEYQKRELTILQQFTEFKAKVLERFQMDLVTDRAGAYLIIAPREQGERAYKDMETGIKREMRKGLNRIKNVNTEQLSATERQKLMDLYAKAADLAQRTRMARRLPMDDTDD